MAENNSEEYSLGSPLVHIKMCESHELPIDIICEDCDEFICAKCAKTDHRDHECKTLTTAATERRRGLLRFLKKIKEEDLPGIDEKMEKIPQQITENKGLCDTEIKNLQKHCDELMARLTKIKKRHEQTLRDNLVKNNDQLNHMKSELKKKKTEIFDTVEFMEENYSAMSDYNLIDNQRELTKKLSESEVHTTNCEHLVRFYKGQINNDILESLVGRTLDNISVTQINSFQYRDQGIYTLETISEDQCYIYDFDSNYIEKVNLQGIQEHRFSVSSTNAICVTDTGDVFFTDFRNKSISCLSPSGSVSTVISTDPLEPLGNCQSVDGGLLVTLADNESADYELESNSRRLVRHITVTGDVIHEYEYQKDGQTRLFILPLRVTQNSNSNICVVNDTSTSTGELVIMSPSGRIKSVYRGKNLTEDFRPNDVVCDSLCNILVTDRNIKQIHLLSPAGEFLKFLMTDNQVNLPVSLSLNEGTLWVGYQEGLVKVFQYKL